MRSNKNLKWLVSQAVKRTRYKGGSYRRGVEITGHDIIRNAAITTSQKEKCIKEVIEELKRPHDYVVLVILFTDGEVREAEPLQTTIKNITVRELDAILHDFIVTKAEETIKTKDWAYGFIATPSKSVSFSEEEIDEFITELENNEIWNQDKRLAILQSYAEELASRI